jgi:dTDP-4-dehydrorhamnose reductase
MGKSKIVVTGANGQLGRELRDLSALHPQFDFIFLTREDLPVQDSAKTLAFFKTTRPAYCINCAAYTAVDKAEADKDLAYLVNGEAVGMLAAACSQVNARLIHISTDYVFDGLSATPLKEGDPTGPINIYGASKLQGEQLAMQEQGETVIIRTSWVYSVYGHNFVKTMIRLMREKESINVINDQIGSPTYAADLAEVIAQIVSGPVFVPGIYHYSNEGQISWYDFALAIRELTGSTCQVNPIPASQYPTPAKRPHYSLLDKSLIKSTYGISIPMWKDSLAICLERLTRIA